MDQLIPVKYINKDGTVFIKNGIKRNKNSKIKSNRKPSWFKRKAFASDRFKEIRKIINSKDLFTVCEEAICPNLEECWSHGTATFMLLGGICTRACKFCAVGTGNPHGKLDNEEPIKISNAIQKMKLKYVVLTSVDRDDLPDGGAGHYARTVKEIKKTLPEIIVETLVPDFQGNKESIYKLIFSGLDVFAQNLETVERLTSRVRDPRASYNQTLDVLITAKQYNPKVVTKSSLMLGLGEKKHEVFKAMADILSCGVEILTLGQYLRPTINHLPVERWISPDEFMSYARIAKDMGFREVASGPMVRSSFRADKSSFLVKEANSRDQL